MAKLIIKKSVEIYNEEYSIGNNIPYVYWEENDKIKELYHPKLSGINEEKGTIALIPKGRKDLKTYHEIKIDDIKINEKMHCFEYRTMSGSYYCSYQGIVYAKTPQEAVEQLKDTILKTIWSKKYSDWQGDISYLELFYNGMPCPARTGIYLFPEAYSELNVKNEQFTDKVFLQDIADKISEQTGIKNKLVVCNNWLTWDFDYEMSYMTSCNGTGLSFTLMDEKGHDIWSINTTNEKRFIKEVSEALNREQNKLKNQEEQER